MKKSFFVIFHSLVFKKLDNFLTWILDITGHVETEVLMSMVISKS